MKRITVILLVLFSLTSCGRMIKWLDENSEENKKRNPKPKKEYYQSTEDEVNEWLEQMEEDDDIEYEELGSGDWELIVPVRVNDDEEREQKVLVTVIEGGSGELDIFDIRAKVSNMDNLQLDLLGLLNFSKRGYYSTVCIRGDEEFDGGVKMIYVQAGPVIEYTNYEQFEFIVHEVAANADIIEAEMNNGEDNF